MYIYTCTYLLLFSANSISSRGDYSRAASISFRACSGAATIRERRLFESGVYSVIYGSFRPTAAALHGRRSHTVDRGTYNSACAIKDDER